MCLLWFEIVFFKYIVFIVYEVNDFWFYINSKCFDIFRNLFIVIFIWLFICWMYVVYSKYGCVVYMKIFFKKRGGYWKNFYDYSN